MNMTTQFTKGQRVKANQSIQGLIANNSYTVEDVHSLNTPFGNFVTYYVRNADGPLLPITNGHLLLTAVNS